MDPLESRLGRFTVTAHLFRLVDELPRDKQLILLKQLVGDRLTAHLFKMIIEMPEQQRQQLSEHLEMATFDEGPITTLHLDDEVSSIRQIHRKPCRLRAICVVKERTFESVITDISTEGMFIQASADYDPKTPIRISVRFPGRDKALVLSGEILRSEAGGIGVQLTPLTLDQAEAIRNFLLSHT
ncbi:MAG: PilZ domain-containing protein [Desulfobacteraceae bacterium]|nr:MAG: PilZ domain-containing protein [Desulfobacteraceae bacterium]